MTVPAGQTRTADRPVAVFVMGMGRSGTSAITRVLSLCGGALPTGLVTANSANPLGYWEPRAALELNDAILRRHRSNWADPTLRLQEEGAFDAEERAACVARIRTFLATLPAGPLVVIKDMRVTALSGLWFEAARSAGFDVAAVIAIRHPQEVIASLTAFIQDSPELSSALWLKYNLLAERDTRRIPRVFVEYANLLDDWRRETKRISTALAVDLNAPDEGAIEEFLKPSLRRQQHGGGVTEPFAADWICGTYELLRAAAADQPWDQSGLDRVYESYRVSEYGFRTALEDYYEYSRELSRFKKIGPITLRLGSRQRLRKHR